MMSWKLLAGNKKTAQLPRADTKKGKKRGFWGSKHSDSFESKKLPFSIIISVTKKRAIKGVKKGKKRRLKYRRSITKIDNNHWTDNFKATIKMSKKKKKKCPFFCVGVFSRSVRNCKQKVATRIPKSLPRTLQPCWFLLCDDTLSEGQKASGCV